MNFRQFAFNNVKRNTQTYLAFFLSSTFAVMTFFVYLMFLFHPEISQHEFGELTQAITRVASWMTFFFSFLFVFYSLSSFLRSRMKEFGIMTLLGMTRRQWNQMIFLENMIIGSGAIFFGMMLGLLFSKLFLLIGSRAMDIGALSLYLPYQAIGITIISFIPLFAILSLFSLFIVRQTKALEMLQGKSKPKPAPRGSIWLALLAIACLAGAYGYLTQELNEKRILIILLLNLIGTYLFFSQFTLFVIRLLKKQQRLYWRGVHLLWITEMAYKLKDHARMFFMISFVTAIACVSTGAVLTIHQKNALVYQNEAFAFQYLLKNTSEEQQELRAIEQRLRDAHISYQRVAVKSFWIEIQENKHIKVISQSAYNQMAKIGKMKPLSLGTHEAYYLYTDEVERRSEFKMPDQIKFKGGNQTLQVHGQLGKKLISHEMLVVNHVTYQQLFEQFSVEEDTTMLLDVPAWSNDQFPSMTSDEAKISLTLYEQNQEKLHQGKEVGFLLSRAQTYLIMKQAMNMMMFIGLFIAAIFSVFSASFLYFKLFNDLQQDQQLYHSLSKVGLSWRETKQTVTIQIAALFYVPFVVAVIQSWIGLKSVSTYLNMTATLAPTFITISVFFLIQTIYFLLIRVRYLKKLKRIIV